MSDQKQDLALWRYAIISPLLHREVNGSGQGELLFRLSHKWWLHPLGHEVQVSAETIRKWLYRYQQRGLPGLFNQERNDKGGCPGLPEKITKMIFQLRKAHPRWTIKRILHQLKKLGLWNGYRPSQSSIYRFIKKHNLQRDPHLAQAACRSFNFDAFGQLWVADFLHGPKVKMGRQRHKTYLHAIMDDASRYIVQAAFHPAETVEVLIHEMTRATRRFGLPQRFYTDNGPSYASRHLKVVCARLSIQLIHTPAYRPQGRGKIERFFRTVRDQFLTDSCFASMEGLNNGLQSWLAEYHQQVHSTLEASPFQQRIQSENVCRQLPEIADIDSLFRMERRCRVYKNGTVRLFGNRYEIPNSLPGTRVKVFFLPWDKETIYFGEDAQPATILNTSENARRFHHPKGGSDVLSTKHE